MRTLDPTRLQTVVNGHLTALLKKYAERVLRRGKHQAQVARDVARRELRVEACCQGSGPTPAARRSSSWEGGAWGWR